MRIVEASLVGALASLLLICFIPEPYPIVQHWSMLFSAFDLVEYTYLPFKEVIVEASLLSLEVTYVLVSSQVFLAPRSLSEMKVIVAVTLKLFQIVVLILGLPLKVVEMPLAVGASRVLAEVDEVMLVDPLVLHTFSALS